jgi:probable HAF family extracellular repeat protein
MPNGSFWVGKGGFNYKRSGGGGGRRNFSLGLITNQPADVNNTYVVGAGVGASSRATRRAKMLHATVNTPQYPYNRMFNRLGLQASGGSNDYAYNWYFNDVWPNPYPSVSNKTLKYIILPSLYDGESYATTATATSNDGSIIVGSSRAEGGATVAVRWVNGSIQNLGLLPGDDYSNANFCSSDGSIIVGASSSNAGERAVKWVNGIITELTPGTISGANGCSPDGSIIVGYYKPVINEVACFWINNDGTPKDLPGLNGTFCQAVGCSSNGSIIVGISNDSLNPNTIKGVKWVKNPSTNSYEITTLGTLSGKTITFARNCSYNGTTIIGAASLNLDPTTIKAISWVNNSVNALSLESLPSDIASEASGCSADGTIIVGSSNGLNDAGDYSTAVKWTNNSISSLGIPSGYISSQANSCSSDGSIIVGLASINTSTSSAIKWYYG